MATKLADVACQANVSVAIASRVLNKKPGPWASEATRQRIFDVAKELNYRPSATGRALVTGKTMQIGVSAADQDWLHGRSGRALQMRGLIDATAECDYSVVIIPSSGTHADVQHFREWVEGSKCDAYCLFAEQGDSSLYRFFRETETTYLIIGNPGDTSLPQVDHDNYSLCYSATSWLADQGFKRVGFVNPTPPGKIFPPHVLEMVAGVRSAHETKLGGLDPRLMMDPSLSESSIMASIERSQPDAIVIYGGLRALRWRSVMERHGINVPKDIALLCLLDVAGISDLERICLAEGLAFQVYDPHLVGQMAGRMLISRIRGESPRENRQLVPGRQPFWWKEPIYATPDML